jgi:hypothetical protein
MAWAFVMPGGDHHLPARYQPAAKTYGYRRSRDVPGPNPKVCKTCDKWFAARPRESVCDGCMPAHKRVKRLALAHHTRTPSRRSQTPRSQGIYSEALAVTFQPGVPLWKVLAFEAAQKVDRGWRPPPETLAQARAADRRLSRWSPSDEELAEAELSGSQDRQGPGGLGSDPSGRGPRDALRCQGAA